jgi:hypothetical protein
MALKIGDIDPPRDLETRGRGSAAAAAPRARARRRPAARHRACLRVAYRINITLRYTRRDIYPHSRAFSFASPRRRSVGARKPAV